MTRISSPRRSNSNTDRTVLALGAVAALTAVLFAAPALAADGAALFAKNCQSCHGPDGKGKTKMGEKLKVRDLTAADVKSGLTKQKIVDSMKNGVKDPAGGDKLVMKSFAEKLTDEEMQAVADHTLALK